MAISNIHHDRVALNKIRNREIALRAVLPCALWILKLSGCTKYGYPGKSVSLSDDVVLSVSQIDDRRCALSVYTFVKGREKKVFSAHVTITPHLVDTNFYRYCEGYVDVVGWIRGEWENVVLLSAANHDAEGFSEVLRSLETFH